jgi:transposase
MFKEYNQYQSQLLPSSLNESIKKDHIARLINNVIDGMDLSFIENTYSFNGQKAYHPKMLFKVLVYGYAIGIRSSRKLADKLNEDIVFMWLSGKQTPDFRTIADFRKDKLKDVKKAFTQVLSLCQELGIIKIGKVFLDGTKLRASASDNRVRYRKVLERRRDDIEKQIEDIFNEAEETDKEEEKLYGENTEHSTGIDIEKALNNLQRRKQTLDKLEAKKLDVNVKLRKMRKDRNSMGIADKDATVMMMKEGYIAPGYNVQCATEHQVILAYDISSDRNDQKRLKPMIGEIQENTGEKPKILTADAGYGTKSNYRYLKNQRIPSFIPYNSFNKEMIERRKNVYQLPKKIDVELERCKFKQRLRLLSPFGKKLMERRRQDIEPVFGDMKRNMGFRAFYLRGKPKCLIEMGLVGIGHNLKKIKSYIEKRMKYMDCRKNVLELGAVLGYQSP